MKITLPLRVFMLFALSFALVLADSPVKAFAGLAVCLVSALLLARRFRLVLMAAVIPLPGILMSHLLIEPLSLGKALQLTDVQGALQAGLRLSALSALSVGFIASLSLQDMADISRRLGLRSRLLLAWVLIRSALANAQAIYHEARIVNAFDTEGNLRRKKGIRLKDIGPLGIAVLVTMLATATDVAATIRGRGIRTHKLPARAAVREP